MTLLTGKSVTLQKVKKQYERHPSFSDLLPFADWSEDKRCFLLEDGVSVGCLLEIRDVATEARPEAMIEELHSKLTQTLSRVVPLEDNNPWVIQFFAQDDMSLAGLYHRLQHYIPKDLHHKKATQCYLMLMENQLKRLTRQGGLFEDPLSDIAFRGKVRKLRVALYRRYSDKRYLPDQDVCEELQTVCDALITNLQAFGVKVRRMQGHHIYNWLVRWFNPHPVSTDGSVDALLEKFPYPNDRYKCLGWSFSENTLFNQPTSFAQGWEFDDIKHKVMIFRELSQTIDIGVISRERTLGDKKYAVLDKLPDGCIYTLQITFESKYAIERHLTTIEKSAVGKGDEPKRVKHNVNRALSEIINNNMLFRVAQAVYYRAPDDESLRTVERQLVALLANVSLTVVKPQDEVNPIDNYLRFLPFNFNPHMDKKYLYRSTYQYASDIAALLPIYGRSRGDGQFPLNIFYNRTGEPFIFDQFHPQFKMANSHMAIIGSTGAGKSVFLNVLVTQLIAVKNARVFIIEAGGSFDLLSRNLANHDVSVTRLNFSYAKPISVNPFAEGYKALQRLELEEQALTAESQKNILEKHAEKIHKELNEHAHSTITTESIGDENRDILSEMTLALRTMITGGLEKEEERFTLADDMLLMEVLIDTLKHCRSQGALQMVTHHLVEGFQRAVDEKKDSMPEVVKRLDEMRRALAGFIQSPLRSRFFNYPSAPLPDNDLTVIDLGFLQEKQNSAMLSVVAISLLAKILAVAEANQHSNRPTVLVLDEAHIPFKNPLVAAFAILMTKVGRKFGLWLVPCTQNVADLNSAEAKKVLSLMETIICLAVSRNEIEEIKKFRNITPEEESMLLDIRKYPGLYSEGVLLGARYKGLFRNIPPRLMLAFAMTEQIEKAERQKIMDEQGVDELKAAEIVAERLNQLKPTMKEDEGFDD